MNYSGLAQQAYHVISMDALTNHKNFRRIYWDIKLIRILKCHRTHKRKATLHWKFQIALVQELLADEAQTELQRYMVVKGTHFFHSSTS
jgi:hypothetical protein